MRRGDRRCAMIASAIGPIDRVDRIADAS